MQFNWNTFARDAHIVHFYQLYKYFTSNTNTVVGHVNALQKVKLDSSPTRYLGPLTCLADVTDWRELSSAARSRLVEPSFKLSAIGSQAFPTAAAEIWNALPDMSSQHHSSTRSGPSINWKNPVSKIVLLLALCMTFNSLDY